MTNKALIIQYIESDNHGCGDMYFNENGEFLTFINDNDADWRHEYFNPIFKKIGVKIIKGDFSEKYLNELLDEQYE